MPEVEKLKTVIKSLQVSNEEFNKDLIELTRKLFDFSHELDDKQKIKFSSLLSKATMLKQDYEYKTQGQLYNSLLALFADNSFNSSLLNIKTITNLITRFF